MSAAGPEVLGVFHGDEFSRSSGGGGERSSSGARRSPLSPSGLADVLRHRRLVVDLRPHVSPVRNALRGRLDREADQRLPLHRGRPGRSRVQARGRGVRRQVRGAGAPGDRYPEQIGPYLDWTLPYYARTFMAWWRERFVPEMDRNFALLDAVDYEHAPLLELAVVLEDAIEIHQRHWKIHWLINFAQFTATTALEATVREVTGTADPALLGRLQSSLQDRNWDAVNDLWEIKREVIGDPVLHEAFAAGGARDVIRALGQSEPGRRLLNGRIKAHQKTFGYKTIWSHEVRFPLWVEDPSSIVEAIRGYVASDFEFPAALAAVTEDLESAKVELLTDLRGEDRAKVSSAMELALGMNPLTPDHHFYIDQGTNARLRIVLLAIGNRLTEANVLRTRRSGRTCATRSCAR